jgi:hypothetical protein
MTDREQFEAWLEQQDINGSGVTNLVYCRGNSIDLADVWHGWQAARAAPAQPAKGHGNDPTGGWCSGIGGGRP